MNICSIGRDFVGDNVTNIDFASTRTILEFDAVFIDSAGLANLPPDSRVVNFRKDEFLEFLSFGRTIVFFIGTLRLAEFIPFVKPIDLKALSGQRFEFIGSDYLKLFWQAVQPDMQYLAHFEKDNCPGKPFLFVPSTNRAVGTLIKFDRGNILLLPYLTNAFRDHFANRDCCARFISAFTKLNAHLAPKKSTIEFPAWSTHYGWQRERELRNELISLQKQSADILKKIGQTSAELDVEDKLKVLFTAKGDILLEMVMDVFRSLGTKATGGEPGRDDIIIEFEGKPAVAEVKGKKKSAAEEDAAQLEKWVAGFKAEKGSDPKGILLINAFCETPLAERNEPPFPHQMLKYSSQREHCLITTLQLLGLLLEARAHPEKRVELVNSLFSTVGVYPEFTDWKKFLISSEPAKAK